MSSLPITYHWPAIALLPSQDLSTTASSECPVGHQLARATHASAAIKHRLGPGFAAEAVSDGRQYGLETLGPQAGGLTIAEVRYELRVGCTMTQSNSRESRIQR